MADILTYGQVVGRFIAIVGDKPTDLDDYPDIVPLTGSVTLTPRIEAALLPGHQSGPLTAIARPIQAQLDSQGYISRNGVRGVYVVATDNPAIGVTDFTYLVSFENLRSEGALVRYPSFSITVKAGDVIDLALVAPVPVSDGAVLVPDVARINELVGAAEVRLFARLEAELEQYDGVPGPEGKSAYQGWLAAGNVGNFDAFLTTLRGPKGDVGPRGEVGPRGDRGPAGLSAYEAWLDAGFSGTFGDYLASIKGLPGEKGEMGSPYAPPDGQRVVTVYSADGQVSDPVAAAGFDSRYLRKGEVSFNIWDYGARPQNLDNTAFVQAAIMDAFNAGGGKVLVPPGLYRVAGINQPDFVQLEATGGALTRFGKGDVRGAARFIRTVGSTAAYTWRIAGHGSVLHNVEIDGDGQAYRGLIVSGFELTLDTVRVINCKAIGIDVERANNTRWRDVYVDNCGTKTEYAMKIWSKTGASGGISNETNTVDIYGLTIERSANGALSIAEGTDAQAWAEFLRIFALHIEAPVDNGGQANDVALLAIGNVRSLDLIAPFIYGGPGPLISHNQTVNRGSGANGGVRIVAGQLFGSDASAGVVPATPTLVSLLAGDNFALEGTKLDRYTGSPVIVAAGYGPRFFVSADTTMSSGTIQDARATSTLYNVYGDLRVEGTIRSGRPVVSVVRDAARVASTTPNNCSDTRGTVFFQGGAATAGALFTINFAKAHRVQPSIAVTPKNELTAGLNLYAAVAANGLSVTIYTATPLVVQAAANLYQLDYIIQG